jgi:urease accessory protein
MIQKIVNIQKDITSQDSVELSWFDMQKPHLSAVSKKGIEFIIKTKFTHLHENDVLISEEGYAIKVIRGQEDIYVLQFNDHLTFATTAYEIGNRHQPICLEDYQITVLNDLSLKDIIQHLKHNHNVEVTQTKGYFKPNGKAHHSH